AIARRAAILRRCAPAAVFRLEGGVINLVAHHSGTREWLALVKNMFPADARERPVGWVALERRTLHFADIENDPRATSEFRAAARALGFRRGLLVPMHRGEPSLGAIGVGHAEPGAFSDRQIALLQTFADQAVIAIENVRLFTELEGRNRDLSEALEQQTATSEILRAISSSPTDTQPVFDAIVSSAARLCDGTFSTAWRFDGELLHRVAHYNFEPERVETVLRMGPIELSRGSVASRAVMERAVVHVADIESDPELSGTQAFGRVLGVRAVLVAPMLREGQPIGVIGVSRRDPRPFTPRQTALLKTFADQAVNAIENVPLVNELETRDRG